MQYEKKNPAAAGTAGGANELSKALTQTNSSTAAGRPQTAACAMPPITIRHTAPEDTFYVTVAGHGELVLDGDRLISNLRFRRTCRKHFGVEFERVSPSRWVDIINTAIAVGREQGVVS